MPLTAIAEHELHPARYVTGTVFCFILFFADAVNIEASLVID